MARATTSDPAIRRGLSYPMGSFRLAPTAYLSGTAAETAIAGGWARRLAGGSLAFAACRLMDPSADAAAVAMPLPALLAWAEQRGEDTASEIHTALDRLTAPRPAFAGLAMDRPRVMGIVNVTPDSFSDGGRFFDAQTAIDHGRTLLDQGADILDIGGESTRPGSAAVEPDEEIRRVVPVVRALAQSGAVISIDTRHAAVMEASIAAGATIINDISALDGDPRSLAVAAASQAAVVLMHMQGQPRDMQTNPSYAHAPVDIFDYLGARIDACVAAGIDAARISIDPGIGFGKTLAHNSEVMAALGLFHGFGVPVLLGVSRKSFIARISRDEPAEHRLGGSLAAALAGLAQGAQIVRVHDVAETAQALKVWRAIA